MRVLVLGGTGLTGRPMVAELVARGHEVTVFSRRAGGVPEGVRQVLGDRERLGEYAGALRGVGADCVVDMLAMHGRHAEDLLGVFGGHVGQVVVASSMDVYRAYGAVVGKEAAGPERMPLDEGAPLRTVRHVRGGEAYEKLEVEEVLAAGGVPATVIRMPAVYGAGDRQHRFAALLTPMVDKRPYVLLEPAYANWLFTHGYAGDVAHAFVLAAERGGEGYRVYNVGEARTPTVGERAHALARAAGYKGKILVLPRDRCPGHLVKGGFETDLAVSSRRIRTELGYAEVVEEMAGLKATAAWEAEALRSGEVPAVAEVRAGYEAEDEVLRGLGLIG